MKKSPFSLFLFLVIAIGLLAPPVWKCLANDPASPSNPPSQGAYRVMSWMTDWSTRWDTNQNSVDAVNQLLANTNAVQQLITILLPYIGVTNVTTTSNTVTFVYVYVTNNAYITNFTYVTNNTTTTITTNNYTTNNVTTTITNAGFFNLWATNAITNTQSTITLNMSSAQYWDIYCSNQLGNAVSVTLTNFPTTTNQAMVAVFNFRNLAVATNLNLIWNPNFTWVSQTGTIPPPTNILAASVCQVSLFISPTGNTNVVGSINP